jgi:hypothetical protein
MQNGGNAWSGYPAFLSFFRHVSKLDLDYSKWSHYETLATAGWRVMHEEFCIISERPVRLLVDEENRPHSESGAFCEWSTGEGLYAWRGVRVPAKWILDRSTITPEIALTWKNIEQRRVACEMLGWHNLLHHPSLNAKVIDRNSKPHIGVLYEVELPDAGKTKIVKAECATGRTFGFIVPPESKTSAEGIARTYGWTEDMPIDPEDFIPHLTA